MGKTKFYMIILLYLAFVAKSANAASWVDCHSDDYCGGGATNYSSGKVDIVNDSTSPDSSPSVWRFTFNQGTTAGHGIAEVSFGVPYNNNEMWIRYYFKYSTGFVYQNIATKQAYVYTAGSSSSNAMFAFGSTNAGYNSTPQGSDFANYPPNVNTSKWYMTQTGVWHKVLLHIKFNSGSTWNGIYQAWIDDALITNYNNVMWDRGYSGWSNFSILPIWGGGSGNSVPQTQYFYVDGLYIGSTSPGGNTSAKIPAPPNSLIIE